MRLLKKLAVVAILSAAGGMLLLWLVFSSALFRDIRVSFVANTLAEQIGQPVVIDGDVQLSMSARPVIIATGLRLPAESFPDLDLAKLNLIRFVISLPAILNDGIYLERIEARGLDVLLIQRADGAKTWRVSDPAESNIDDVEEQAFQPDLIGFLGARDVVFSDMRVRVDNQFTGFEFDFGLENFEVDHHVQSGVSTANLRSNGSINGQRFDFSGEFPDNTPFEARGLFGELTFTMDGQKPLGAPRGEFDARLSMQTPDVQNLIDLLRLKGTVRAAGDAEMQILRRDGRIDLEDIDLEMSLQNGRSAQLTGRFADARYGHDFDLRLFVDFIGPNGSETPAIFLRDIRPTTADLRVIARDNKIEIDRFDLQTNAFEEEIRDIGPFRVEHVIRTDDGRLQLDGVTLKVGPEDRPYLNATGSMESLLTLEGYKLTGNLDLPAGAVLLTMLPEEAARFGRLTGEMLLQETNGKPELQRFLLQSQESDLWSAEIDLKIADIAKVEDLQFHANINTKDGGNLLEAMRFEPVDIGFMGYKVSATRIGKELKAETVISAGESRLETSIVSHWRGLNPVLRGTVRSDEIRIADVVNEIRALKQLARFKSVYVDTRQATPPVDDDEFQPLVLPDASDKPTETAETDLSEFQPLVIPEEQREDLSDFQPLVISDSATDLSIDDVTNPRHLLRRIDAEIDIEIDRISGQEGVSQLKSSLQLQSGNMQLGPVNLAYGAGFADVTARMDFVDAPDLLRLTGHTGGWDVGKILDGMDVNFGAYGTLDGRFDLVGTASAEAFPRTMSGNATINMTNGRLDTGLIELAGLGVLPWLFSKERRQGFADIVCLKAPLTFANGRIETSETVLETARVQMVGSGSVDLKKETISFLAEPRPVGQPLSRSAWPVEVSGSLKSPNIKIAKRKHRRAMVPLAMPDRRTPCVPDIGQLREVPG